MAGLLSPPDRQPGAQPRGLLDMAAGQGPGFWRTLDGVLGGKTITGVRDNWKAKQAAQEDRLRLLGDISQLPLEQRVAAALNASKLGEAYAEQVKPFTLSEGQGRFGAAGALIAQAPKVDKVGGQYGAVDVPTGQFRPLGNIAPTVGELESARANAERERLEREKQDWTETTAGLPTGFRPEVGPNGLPTGRFLADPQYLKLEKMRHPGRAAGSGGVPPPPSGFVMEK